MPDGPTAHGVPSQAQGHQAAHTVLQALHAGVGVRQSPAQATPFTPVPPLADAVVVQPTLNLRTALISLFLSPFL